MTTTELPDLTGFTEHNGIRMTAIGDDGETLLALGHHDPVKTVHAFHWLLRHRLGDNGLPERGTPREVAEDVHALWAVTLTECGDCGGRSDCLDCAAIKSSDWWIDYSASEQDLGRFPVMVLHLDD